MPELNGLAARVVEHIRDFLKARDQFRVPQGLPYCGDSDLMKLNTPYGRPPQVPQTPFQHCGESDLLALTTPFQRPGSGMPKWPKLADGGSQLAASTSARQHAPA
eukprot:gene11337-20188_t